MSTALDILDRPVGSVGNYPVRGNDIAAVYAMLGSHSAQGRLWEREAERFEATLPARHG